MAVLRIINLKGIRELIMNENLKNLGAYCSLVASLAAAGLSLAACAASTGREGREARGEKALIQFFENGAFKFEKQEWRTRPDTIKDASGAVREVEVQVVKIEALCSDDKGKMAPCAEARRMEVHEYDKKGNSLFRTYLVRSGQDGPEAGARRP